MVSIGMLALMTNPGCKKVKFVYTNNLLMQKDIDDYEDLWKLLGLEQKIKYMVGLDIH
jgi:hypothetical protein